MLSLCLFWVFICLKRWRWGGGVGFLILFPSIQFFLSLPVKTHLFLFPASFTPPLSFHPCFQPQGGILLWTGRPASHGFNPAMEFVIFDNLLMEAGMKALACVNKHSPHTPLWKATEGERKQKLGELKLTFRSNATLPGLVWHLPTAQTDSVLFFHQIMRNC